MEALTQKDYTKGYIEYCTITIIDNKTKSLISEKRLKGVGADKFTYYAKRGTKPPKKKIFKVSVNTILSSILNA